MVCRRDGAALAGIEGAVLVSDVRDAGGRVVLERGSIVGSEQRAVLESLPWDSLHVVRPEAGDVLEADAGTRLARAAAGSGVEAGEAAGGH